MNSSKTLEITEWAVNLANTYGIGVQGIVASFIKARQVLESDELAKTFVEKEMSEVRVACEQ